MSQEYVSKNLKTVECEPWKRDISRVGDVIASATSGRRNLRVYGKLPFPARARARNLITKRRRRTSQGFRESTHSRRESCAMQIPYAALKRFAASKCLLKRARLLLRSFVRAWHLWRIGSWKEGFKAKGQAKRAAPRRAENELAYKITIPVPFDVSLSTHRRSPYFPSSYESGFIYLTAILERP